MYCFGFRKKKQISTFLNTHCLKPLKYNTVKELIVFEMGTLKNYLILIFHNFFISKTCLMMENPDFPGCCEINDEKTVNCTT